MGCRTAMPSEGSGVARNPADPDRYPPRVAKSEYTMLEAAGHEVRLSNPAKVYFPKPGWTKLDLAQYYLTAADAALVHVRERPTVLKRFVNGINEEPIWQKRVPQKLPEWLETCQITFPSGRTADALRVTHPAAIVWAAQMGTITLHPWQVRCPDAEHPDELRVDLDPTPGITWDAVRRTAMVVRDVLADHGLRGYPKTSGSKGIHVNVRIEPLWDHLEVRRAALALAREVERRAPDLATSKWWKEERHGVFVDYNQNARDRTVASCYSVRPTPDARVSCALAWDEVLDVEPGDLRLDTVPERLRTFGDPAADIDAEPGSLEALHDLARRDEAGGLGDAPWPPHFPKQTGEPKRVQPSRDRDRPPSHRGRAGDPQPGGPPPGVTTGGLQRGFGSKPRTGQGYEHEFDD
jgi:bifunctional non-homologous end joining protein LigD